MAMALDDSLCTVAGKYLGPGFQAAFLGAQTHGTAQVGSIVAGFHGAGGIGPLGDQAHDRMATVLVELGGVGVGPAQHVAGELDHRHLHA